MHRKKSQVGRLGNILNYLANKFWKINTKKVFLHFETTRLRDARPVSVGMCFYYTKDPDTIYEAYHLLDPECEIPKEASAIHGITNEMVKDEPTFANLYPLFEHIEGSELYCYNAEYYCGVADRAVRRMGISNGPRIEEITKDGHVHCVQKAIANLQDDGIRLKLGDACKKYEVSVDYDKGSHDALYVAKCTMELHRKVFGV